MHTAQGTDQTRAYIVFSKDAAETQLSQMLQIQGTHSSCVVWACVGLQTLGMSIVLVSDWC